MHGSLLVCLLQGLRQVFSHHFLNGFFENFAGLESSAFRFSSCDDHLALSKDKGSCLRLSNSHHHSWKPAWVVLSVTTAHSNLP